MKFKVFILLILTLLIIGTLVIAEPYQWGEDAPFIRVNQDDFVRLVIDYGSFRNEVQRLIGRWGEELSDEQIIETLNAMLLDRQ